MTPTRSKRHRSRQLVWWRVVGALGVMVIALWMVADFASSWITLTSPYTWRSGSVIYLANASVEATECTVTPQAGAGPQSVQLPAYKPFPFPFNRFLVRGAKVDRTFAGTAVIDCDHPFSVVRGWPLRLLPVAYTSYPIMLGIVLLTCGAVLGGRGRPRWLLSSHLPSI